MKSKGKFRSKGSDILKSPSPTPNSIHTFLANDHSLSDADHSHPPPNFTPHKASSAQKHNRTNTHFHPNTSDSGGDDSHPPTLAAGNINRLHVQIRKDLADKLLERVFQLKREPGRPKKAASQRAIIEAALEAYFERPQNGQGTMPENDQAKDPISSIQPDDTQ